MERVRVRPSIYQVFPRNYSKEGTLRKVIDDLPRIAYMGFDYLYLLPIHPIGKDGRKGSLGCPYSIRDYYAIAEELGTLADFDELIAKAHELGLKVMMDIVLNHSSRDHEWTKSHPEFYIHDGAGNPTSKVPEWSDIADFDYTCPQLADEVIKMLTYWPTRGVDGYRCDVASAVPIKIWQRAKEAIAKDYPDFIWLAESTHSEFIRRMRTHGHYATTDPDIYQAFDIAYNYDIIHFLERAYTEGDILSLTRVLALREYEYPTYASKLWHLENHDQPRIASYIKDRQIIKNWLAFSFLMDGAAFVYNGQEAWAEHMPSLFDKDDIDWRTLDKAYEEKIRQLNALRKKTLPGVMAVVFPESKEVLSFIEYKGQDILYGVFDVLNQQSALPLSLKDGSYHDLLNDRMVSVDKGQLASDLCPCLLAAKVNDLTEDY